jgi:hypothetical protein
MGVQQHITMFHAAAVLLPPSTRCVQQKEPHHAVSTEAHHTSDAGKHQLAYQLETTAGLLVAGKSALHAQQGSQARRRVEM